MPDTADCVRVRFLPRFDSLTALRGEQDWVDAHRRDILEALAGRNPGFRDPEISQWVITRDGDRVVHTRYVPTTHR